MSVEIIKRTPLPNDIVVVTAKRSNPFLIRPFRTFAVSPTSRYALRLRDYTCEASALHEHAVLVRTLQVKRSA